LKNGDKYHLSGPFYHLITTVPFYSITSSYAYLWE
jgi:hypothetical protein